MPLINGVWRNLQQGEVIRPTDCPPDLEVINVGDGDEVKLLGSAWGGIPMFARIGTQFRIARDNRDLPGAEPDPPEVKAEKRNYVFTVEPNGGKRAGRYAEAEG